jgi:hypothetical protein
VHQKSSQINENFSKINQKISVHNIKTDQEYEAEIDSILHINKVNFALKSKQNINNNLNKINKNIAQDLLKNETKNKEYLVTNSTNKPQLKLIIKDTKLNNILNNYEINFNKNYQDGFSNIKRNVCKIDNQNQANSFDIEIKTLSNLFKKYADFCINSSTICDSNIYKNNKKTIQKFTIKKSKNNKNKHKEIAKMFVF